MAAIHSILSEAIDNLIESCIIQVLIGMECRVDDTDQLG